ncbi:MAG: GNAT family N-acetyltransferase [Xanthobacteraceae bacterium]
MSVAAASIADTAPPTVSVNGFDIEVVSDWAQAAARWPLFAASGDDMPFQDIGWLQAWYGAFAGTEIEPLIVFIGIAATGARIALVPLIRRRHRGIRIVEFADLDLTDYNAPILSRNAPRDPASARAMWRALRKALRRTDGGADLIRLRKMPLDIGGAPNPLALLSAARPSSLNGNLLTVGDDFEAHRHTRPRTFRKELERSWRVFTRNPDAAFRMVSGRDDALAVLDIIERQQDARMKDLGLNFVLNDDVNARFYHDLVRDGVERGTVAVSTLTAGDQMVAALIGLRTGRRYTMIRISNAGEAWSNCSPGRLIIERTMAALHRDGVRAFDFSIGNYAYKRRFGTLPVPLADVTAALSWRGLPFVLRDAVAFRLRRHPRLRDRLRQLLGKPPIREESLA